MILFRSATSVGLGARYLEGVLVRFGVLSRDSRTLATMVKGASKKKEGGDKPKKLSPVS